MTKAEVYVQVVAALFAAYRTDAKPSSIEVDVKRTVDTADAMVDAICERLGIKK